MPQFDFATVVWPQLAWLAVSFAILYFGIVRLTLPKLTTTMDAREAQVANDLSVAERAKHEADAMAAAYAAGIEAAHVNARAAIAQAKSKASADVESAVAAGASVIAEKAAAAERVLTAARTKALHEIEAVAAEAASDIVERLTGKRPDATLLAAASRTALAR